MRTLKEIKSCWKGYEAIGMKEKDGKKVPNCVPVKEQLNVKVLSPEELAKKHNKSLDYIQKQIDIGSKVEHEHTKDQDSATKIALAHIEEVPDYYTKLKKYVESQEIFEESPAWQRKEGKSETGGLNRKGVESYRRENPGSKLQTAVTKDPDKIKKGSKEDNRRKSFCRRMTGMKKKLTSAETAKDPDSRINKSLRKWNC